MSEISDKIESLENMNKSFSEHLKNLYEKKLGKGFDVMWFSHDDILEDVEESNYKIKDSNTPKHHIAEFATVYPFQKKVTIDKLHINREEGMSKKAQRVEEVFSKLGYDVEYSNYNY